MSLLDAIRHPPAPWRVLSCVRSEDPTLLVVEVDREPPEVGARLAAAFVASDGRAWVPRSLYVSRVVEACGCVLVLRGELPLECDALVAVVHVSEAEQEPGELPRGVRWLPRPVPPSTRPSTGRRLDDAALAAARAARGEE